MLRFQEFTDSWNEFKFNELVKEYKLGGNYGNTTEPNDKPLMKMGNLNRGSFGFDKVEYINLEEKTDETDLIQYGDLFFNTRNTLDLVGKVAIWRNELPKAYYNSNLMRMKFENNFFMNYAFNSNKGIKALRRLATGTTSVAAIYTKDLLGVKFNIPSLPEQEKIASFLSSIDKKIEQLTKKKELLEQYKKGVLQKIFKQEIRFKQDNGSDFPDWEKKRGEEVFKNHSNKKHDGTLPILSASQEHGMVYRDENGIQIQTSEASVKSYKVVEKGDFVISLRSFQGGIEYSSLLGICSPAYTILKPINPINDIFFKEYFKKEDFIERLSKTVVGIRDGKQISYDAFGGVKLSIPCLDEQTKIADFLEKINTKISFVYSQLEQSKNFKKGLLQQMFV